MNPSEIERQSEAAEARCDNCRHWRAHDDDREYGWCMCEFPKSITVNSHSCPKFAPKFVPLRVSTEDGYVIRCECGRYHDVGRKVIADPRRELLEDLWLLWEREKQPFPDLISNILREAVNLHGLGFYPITDDKIHAAIKRLLVEEAK